jgi:beta-lactamase class D OXA-50
MRRFYVVIAAIIAGACTGAEVQGAPDVEIAAAPPSMQPSAADSAALAAAFTGEGAHGTIVIRRLSDGREWVHDVARADSGFLPASTYKIVHAAIALETGVVTGPDEHFPWDGERHTIDGWNRDHTLASAMEASAVPVYQEVARRIGEERMGTALSRIGYGNADVGGGIDQFWLRGDLRVSAREQVDFLARFVRGEAGFSPRTMTAVAGMLLTDSGPGWALHAKTGWAFEVELGWWAGWTVNDGETYVFALNMAMPDPRADPPRRMRIGRSALEAVGALPASED